MMDYIALSREEYGIIFITSKPHATNGAFRIKIPAMNKEDVKYFLQKQVNIGRRPIEVAYKTAVSLRNDFIAHEDHKRWISKCENVHVTRRDMYKRRLRNNSIAMGVAIEVVKRVVAANEYWYWRVVAAWTIDGERFHHRPSFGNNRSLKDAIEAAVNARRRAYKEPLVTKEELKDYVKKAQKIIQRIALEKDLPLPSKYIN